jgi:tRNA nucleotidyltransferase (CCA-adding enzyme)
MTQACLSDARGRTNFEDDPYPQAAYAWKLVEQLNALDLKPVLDSGLKGKQLGQAIQDFRLHYLKSIIEPVKRS